MTMTHNRFIPGTPGFVGYKPGYYALVRHIASPAIDHILHIKGETQTMLTGDVIGLSPVKMTPAHEEQLSSVSHYGLMKMPISIGEDIAKTMVISVLPSLDVALRYANMYEGARRNMDNMRAILHSEFHKAVEEELGSGGLTHHDDIITHKNGEVDFLSGVSLISWRTSHHQDNSTDFYSIDMDYPEEIAFIRLMVERSNGSLKYGVVPSARSYAAIRKDGRKVSEVLGLFAVDEKTGMAYHYKGSFPSECLAERVAITTGILFKDIGNPVLLENWDDLMVQFGNQETGDDMLDVIQEPAPADYKYPEELYGSLQSKALIPS